MAENFDKIGSFYSKRFSCLSAFNFNQNKALKDCFIVCFFSFLLFFFNQAENSHKETVKRTLLQFLVGVKAMLSP